MKTDGTLAKRVVGFAMKVHSKLGAGFSEGVNQNALLVECARAGLKAEASKKILVHYEGVTVGEFIPDMIVEDPASGEVLLIENKVVSTLVQAHIRQLINYLSATGIDQGLLLNFGAESIEFRTKERQYRKQSGPPDDVDLLA